MSVSDESEHEAIRVLANWGRVRAELERGKELQLPDKEMGTLYAKNADAAKLAGELADLLYSQ